MKKMMVAVVAIALASVAVSFAQEDGANNRPDRPRGGFLAAARTEDGKIDLSKLPEQMNQERKDALKAADKDGDGFLDQEEFRAAMPRRDRQARANDAPQRREGRPNFAPNAAPRFGGPNGFPPFADAFKDGKLELAKLPEQFPQERKDAFKAADKDGDGFLTREELREVAAPKFRFPDGKKPAFVNDDNAFDVEKTIEAIKACDKNSDGVIDADEQKAAAEFIRDNWGFSFNMFLQGVLGSGQGPNGFGGFGAFGPNAPNFGRPDFNAQRGDRERGPRPDRERRGRNR